MQSRRQNIQHVCLLRIRTFLVCFVTNPCSKDKRTQKLRCGCWTETHIDQRHSLDDESEKIMARCGQKYDIVNSRTLLVMAMLPTSYAVPSLPCIKEGVCTYSCTYFCMAHRFQWTQRFVFVCSVCANRGSVLGSMQCSLYS